MTETLTKSDSVIEIHGFPLETKGVIYQVKNKYDADAPSGLKAHKTTKYLDDVTGKNTVSATYSTVGRLWDTGLYEQSPVFKGLSKEKRKETAQKVKELIVEPFENIYGEDLLDPKDKESNFWNYGDDSGFKVDLYDGKIFNTDEPFELLQLYICIINRDLAPVEGQNSPQFRDAQFCVENRDKVVSSKVEDEMLEIDVIGSFHSLLHQPKVLKPILNYIGLKGVDVENKQMATTMFLRFIRDKEQSHQNKKLFDDAVKLNSKKQGKKEIVYYSILQDLQQKGKLPKINDSFTINDTALGVNLKAAAKFVSNKPSLQQEIDAAVNEE